MNSLLPWLRATVLGLHDEAVHAKSITFDVPGWRGHLAGQHVDIRLTAEDGYVAVATVVTVPTPVATQTPMSVNGSSRPFRRPIGSV